LIPFTVSLEDERQIDAYRRLFRVLSQLNEDEIRTVTVLAERLYRGQQQYGKIDLATDPRDFRKERAEEIEDLLIYTAFQALRREGGTG
jgi:hypothetical protein